MRRMVGAEDLRRLLARPLLQPRRRGPGRHRAASARPTPRRASCEINRRAAESDLVIYVNINFVPMDGGHKSVGRRPVRLREPAGAPQPADDPRLRQLHGPEALGAEPQVSSGMGALVDEAPEGLPHRDRAQQPHVRRAARLPGEERGRLHRARPAEVRGDAAGRSRRLPRAAKRKIFHAHARAPTS